MKDKLQLFNFESHKVRTALIDDEPYFVGKDVANILGYSRLQKAVNDHVSPEDKREEIVNISQASQNRTRPELTLLINESGVYSLIFNSKMPNAKKFKHWVTSEVLPSIRKHGTYMTDETIEKVLSDPDTIIKLATQLKDERQLRRDAEKKVETMKPKALFADAVSTSKTAILIGELAKILKGNGVNIGQNRLFAWMRDQGYLISRRGSSYNMPTQLSMNLGLFKIKETSITHSDGHVTISKTPKITGKGQQYFIHKFLKNKEVKNNENNKIK